MSAKHTPAHVGLLIRNLRNGLCGHRHLSVRCYGEDSINTMHALLEMQHELLVALEGVVRVADRATSEFDAARAAILKATGEQA